MYNIKELYQLNIELEGILRVLEQRDSDEARRLLAQKFKIYSDAMAQLLEGNTTAPAAVNSAAEATEALLHEAHHTEVKNQEAVDSEVVPEAVAAEKAIAREESRAVTTVADAVADSARSIKLDEVLSARQATDLSKAFTLNDKYRFRRELFGGSDSDFSHTIDLIVSMNSYEEARDYLLRDLCWDSRNEAVEDFLTIIKRHFQA